MEAEPFFDIGAFASAGMGTVYIWQMIAAEEEKG